MNSQFNRPKTFDFDISEIVESSECNELLFSILKGLREDISSLVLCGFNGDGFAKSSGETFAFKVSEIDVDLSVEDERHPLFYSIFVEQGVSDGKLAVYDLAYLEQPSVEHVVCDIYLITNEVALLAVIDVKP